MVEATQPKEIEETRNHSRNKTGIIGDRKVWSTDSKVNDLWMRLSAPEPSNVPSLQKSFVRHILNTLARTHFNVDDFASYQAAAHTTLGRNTATSYNLGCQTRLLHVHGVPDGEITEQCEAMRQLGVSLEDAMDQEVDAALGNGGLGRLAACFMDSLATLNYPAWGYGLRYKYGIFQQKIKDGYQLEIPDYWLTLGNAWEVERLDVMYEVRFYGDVHRRQDGQGLIWSGGEVVEAVAYDVPIPGFNTKSTINIRLWGSKPLRHDSFDLSSFNEGNYQKSVEEQQKAENITSVLYPNDNTMAGKELRLKQQYFFVCATLQDIVRRFKKFLRPWTEFPNHAAIQLNDTHPTLGIVELQRILIDVERLGWDEAWSIVTRVYSFTNHTVLPEAMEKWPVHMMTALLPRHMQIIYDINLFFLHRVESNFPNDRARLARMSIIEESPFKQVRMAHLAVVGAHTVNGVAAIHSNLIKKTIFHDFVEFYGPAKFCNVTNGITPRRWLHQANPALSDLITATLGHRSWLTELDQLRGLIPFAEDPSFQAKWMQIKRKNKVRLADHVRNTCGLIINPDSLFDVQVKRIHEYKRQFMNILQVIWRYLELKSNPAFAMQVIPRVCIFGGKAAPVIKLINSVSNVINADTQTNRLLQVVFIPDYNVSLAEIIIPASDVSEHISTAGTEASGTSNMKFVLNGGRIVGTMDGANIEIAEEIGSDKIFICGCRADEVEDLRYAQRYRGTPIDPELEKVLQSLQEGRFGDFELFAPLVETLTFGGDYYLVSNDFQSYLTAQTQVDQAFKNSTEWARDCILSAAKMGKFSSDRSIREYANGIWKINPTKIQ